MKDWWGSNWSFISGWLLDSCLAFGGVCLFLLLTGSSLLIYCFTAVVSLVATFIYRQCYEKGYKLKSTENPDIEDKRIAQIREIKALLLFILVVGGGGMLAILTLAGVFLLPPGPSWLPSATILDKAAHGSVVTAAVSWVAGVIALATYFRTYGQKENHHEAQLDETRKIEEARERRERDLAELQRLEAEFAALSNDFAKADSLSRINAAIGLGEIAVKPDPRRLDKEGQVMLDKRKPISLPSVPKQSSVESAHYFEWPDEWRSRKTELNYPYFMRAAHRLAAALHQWEDEAPRSQAVRVLREISEWAKHEDTDEPLLHALVNALAEANRTTWKLVRHQAESCLATGSTENALADLLLLATSTMVTPIQGHEAILKDRLLYDLTEGLYPQTKRGSLPTKPDETPGSRQVNKSQFLEKANGLWATRDSLAAAISYLSEPPELAKAAKEEANSPESRYWLNLMDYRRALDLRQIRMYLASFSSAHLEGADCDGAFFLGSDFKNTHFTSAYCPRVNFSAVKMSGADFRHANVSEASFANATALHGNFTMANCWRSNFEEAKLYDSSFAQACCSDTSFRNAYCQEANFKHANLTRANLTGANFHSAELEGTRLAEAKMGQDGYPKTNFSNREWAKADFSIYEVKASSLSVVQTSTTDVALQEFLNETYPS